MFIGKCNKILSFHFRNEKDNGWYRAKILSVHESEAEVRLVDYGNVCAVPLSELQNVPVDLLSLPEQAFECVLSGVEALPGGWGDACLTRSVLHWIMYCCFTYSNQTLTV